MTKRTSELNELYEELRSKSRQIYFARLSFEERQQTIAERTNIMERIIAAQSGPSRQHSGRVKIAGVRSSKQYARLRSKGIIVRLVGRSHV